VISYERLREIVNGKLVDHTMPDSYESLSEEIFGEGNAYSSSEVRKRLYGMKRLFDVIDSEGALVAEPLVAEPAFAAATAELDKTELKTLEMKKEQKKLQDQRREYTKLLTSDARLEAITERLWDAANRLSMEKPLEVPQIQYDYTDNDAVLILTDWHYGMVAGNMWNHFDTTVCKERVERLVAETIKRLELHRPKTLHIMLLGDFCHGACHVSARVASEELVCEQLMHVSELLAEAISKLAGYAQKTWVYSTYGNHMRVVQSKKDSIHYDNFERIIPWWLQQRLIGTGVIVVEPEYPEFAVAYPCNKFVVTGCHGDLDFSKQTGQVLNSLFQKRRGLSIDCVVMGDRHSHQEFESFGIDVVVVRSLCGTDEYANTKRLYSIPGQTLMIFNPSCGRDATYNIRLD